MNLRAARAALAEAARFGVTTIQDNSSVDALPTYQELHAQGELTARIYVWRYASALPAADAGGDPHGPGRRLDTDGGPEDLLRRLDGLGHGRLFEPYADDPGTSGLLIDPRARAGAEIRGGRAAGFQLAVHAIGDRANALVLDAFEKRPRANGPSDRGFRIEHAQVVRKADVARFQALGIIASMQPSHAATTCAGPRPASARAAAAPTPGAGSSTPASRWPSAPTGSWSPSTRAWASTPRSPASSRRGVPPGGWFPEEKIGLEDALDLYTRGSAYAESAEGEKGTLEPAKLADLAVFARDLFGVAPREILSTPIDLH